MPDVLELDLRYIEIPRRAGLHESECAARSLRLALPVDACAFVLVDVWDDMFAASHVERARRITRERLVPLAAAFRKLGVPVIHAPSPSEAKQYAEFFEPFRDEEIWGPPKFKDDEWPPQAFRKKEGPYERFARPQGPTDPKWDAIIQRRRIDSAIEPQRGDIVIRTGIELHRVLKARQRMWLFYAGYAANVCMFRRDYGMYAMRDRGYEIVLVRDGTTAIEVAETLEGLTLTCHAVITAERQVGYSVSTQELLDACAR